MGADPGNHVLHHADHRDSIIFEHPEAAPDISPGEFMGGGDNDSAMGPELMMTKLSDHHNSPKSLCAHKDPEEVFAPSQTLASVIMIPDKGLVYIANGNPCTTPFLEYRLE